MSAGSPDAVRLHAEPSTADWALSSALTQMTGLYGLMIEFKVPHARAANSAAHVESAIRKLHRIATGIESGANPTEKMGGLMQVTHFTSSPDSMPAADACDRRFTLLAANQTAAEWYVAYCETAAKLKQADACIERLRKLIADRNSPPAAADAGGLSDQDLETIMVDLNMALSEDEAEQMIRFARAVLEVAPRPTAVMAGGLPSQRAEFIRQVLMGVAEIPDRDSSEDQPEMMLVTGAELRGIIGSAFETADERDRPAAMGAGDLFAEFDRLRKLLAFPGYCGGALHTEREAFALALRPTASGSVGKSLLRPAINATTPLPPGCYCEPGKCAAPRIMGRQTPCRDPEKRDRPTANGAGGQRDE